MPRSWRIIKRKHLGSAWDGEGARAHGGRWSSPGQRLVYTAFSRSLGALETLVHLEDSALLVAAYVALPADFADELVTLIGRAELGAAAGSQPPTSLTRAIGDAWIARGRTPVLRVPTAVVPFALEGEPAEVNYLLNPLHPDFSKVERGKPLGFAFDRRLR